ncbi:MAG: NAD(P)/FAD-dependent oxidoreductase [Candidatus Brocadiales bacterium]
MEITERIQRQLYRRLMPFFKARNGEELLLKDGSKIAIIGGGPAGSFFAHFASRFAKKKGLNISITIFDKKSFIKSGPEGCNMCAGVISEKLVDKLQEQHIVIPQSRVQRVIEGYYFQTQNGGVFLKHPDPSRPSKIITVFRGNGPCQSAFGDNISFDDFLIEDVRKRGVDIVHESAKEIILPKNSTDPVRVIFGKRESTQEMTADLVVGAFGVNTGMMEKVHKMGFGYHPPKTVRTCQAEIPLGRSTIEKLFGNNIYVFALGIKRLKFAGITPKTDYVTVNLVGKMDLTKADLIEFLNHPAVRRAMPEGWQMPESYCMCFSKIPVTHAKHPYTNRFVILGDASVSRTYKSGIESAFNMAYLAAKTAFSQGVSEQAFKNGYYKVAKKVLIRDNFYGILMLLLNDYIFSQREISDAHLSLLKSGKNLPVARRINEILWNMVTGNATYKEIFLKAINPQMLIRVMPIDIGAWVKSKLKHGIAGSRGNS